MYVLACAGVCWLVLACFSMTVVGNAKASLKPKPKTTPFPVLQVDPPPFKKPTYQKSSVKSEK